MKSLAREDKNVKIIKYDNSEKMNGGLIQMFNNDIRLLLNTNNFINLGIATGNTFKSFMRYLNNCPDIPLDRINLFMVDEYSNVNPEDEASCAIDLVTELTCLNRFHRFYTFTKEHYLDQIKEYNDLLEEHPFDLLLLGIGENGHYGFCNRYDGILSDKSYKLVSFSKDERWQQVELGWFNDIEEVPLGGITITDYGVLNSGKVVFAAYYEQKKAIIEKIWHSTVNKEMAIYPLLSKENCILLCG